MKPCKSIFRDIEIWRLCQIKVLGIAYEIKTLWVYKLMPITDWLMHLEIIIY